MPSSPIDRRGRPVAAVLLPLAMIAALGGCNRRPNDMPEPTTSPPPTTTSPAPSPSPSTSPSTTTPGMPDAPGSAASR